MILRRLLGLLLITTALGVGTVGLSVPVAQAQLDTGLQEVGQTVKLPSTDPRVIVVNIINVALGLIGIILVSLIVYAGFLWMTSGGDAEKTGKAKKIITNAIIGLVIILSAWAITKFVIEKLLEATQDNGGISSQGGYGGGLGGGGGGQAFIVKSITPSGSVPIRNVEVKIIFNKAVDESSANAILVSKVGGATVGGTIEVNGSVVKFTPAQDCPVPNADRKCFDGDSDFTVKVGASVQSTQGQTVSCGGFGSSCEGAFHTGNLVDTQGPTVKMSYPINGQSVSVDYLQDLQADTTDDSGIGMVEFFEGSNSVFVDAPTDVPSPTVYSALGVWDTVGVALGSHTLTAKASDIDTNTTQGSGISVVVRPMHCFNGVMDDPPETGLDCGGDPSSTEYCGACPGGSCSSNTDCSSGFCIGGSCVEKPVIQSVSPINGRPGTFVTLKGVNFGHSQGAVKFLGDEGSEDDVIALPPQACVDAGINTWYSTQVIVAVPVGGKSGPIEILNQSSNLADATNDGVGPSIPNFLIDNTIHPGLCAVDPSYGTVGKEVDVIGDSFGGASDKVIFGTSELSGPFPLWSETKVRFQVPVVNSAPYPVSVKVGQVESNPVQFTVVDKVLGEAPTLISLDPTEGPVGTYITLFGKNFGWSIGTVSFVNQDGEAIGDVSFPPACSSAFWRDDMIIIKAPGEFTNGSSVSDGNYKVKVKRPDLKESNEIDFSINSTLPLKPGICAIQPAAGPEATVVKLFGDQFGFSKPTVTFSVSKLALVDSNTNQEVKTSVPIGALTGNVKLTAGGQDSNKVNFQVRNCNEAPAEICSPATEQCCPTGECKLKAEQCGAVAERAEFAWKTSTGLIPLAPYVIEECRPDLAPSPTPSPSPWLGRTGGDQAPVDAIVTMRFSQVLEPTTVNKAAFRFLKCTSSSGEPCATTEPVDFDMSGSPYLENGNQSVVKLYPAQLFVTSTVYQVKVASTVKAFGPGGGTMEVDANCGTGTGGQTYGYCFRFKTKGTTEVSAVGAVNVIPSPYTMNNSGDTEKYSAIPLYSQDKCIVLNCKKFDWNWYTGSISTPDGRADITNDKFNGLGKCEQVGTGLQETGSVPVDINTELTQTIPIIGTANLFINFQPPKVEAFGPQCDQACLNGKIWARFSSQLNEATVMNQDNIVIQKCYNENCVESELSLPLDTSKMQVELIEPYGSQGDTKRLIDITPAYHLEPGGFYRVLIKGGPGSPQGIVGANGVPMTGLNHPLGFTWTFRTKLGTAGMCKAERIDVVPLEKYEKSVIASQLFVATPFGSPDICNAGGQPLIQSEGAAWESSDTDVADLYEINGDLIDTGGNLPSGCTQKCLASGAQAEYNKVAVCGNGIIETTDPVYCKAGKTPKNDDCKLMPTGSKAGEECESSIDGSACNINTCLWMPIKSVMSGGTCGNGVVDLGAGEACDFGPTCVGGSVATSSPPVPENSLCVTTGEKTACTQAGGTCDMHSYRGCSANCKHLGSTAGNSTCGNSDNLGDGKDCDDGNTTSNDGCSALCLHEGSEPSNKIFSVCGNTILEPGETCERSDVMSPFPGGCNSKTCLHTGKLACTAPTNSNCCGNGNLDSGEDCDDRNLKNGDGCSASCLFEGSSPAYYKGNVLSPSFCGNGILERGEQCEVGLSSNKAAQEIDYGDPLADEESILGNIYGAGDGLIDSQQLAFIVGNTLPDPDTGVMSSEIKVELEGNKNQAKYGLQCGFSDESSCPTGFGLDDYGCCAPRPKTNYKYPMGKDICRNVQISAKFNVPMKTESILGNFEVLEQQPTGNCPTGTTEILIVKEYGPGIWNWIKKTWDKVVSWVTGLPTYAQKWCKGAVSGQLKSIGGGATSTAFTYTLDKALNADTLYHVRFLGDNSTSSNPLSDNADINKRLGIKTLRGVVHEFEIGSNGELNWEFKTGKDICLVNVVTVQDVTPDPDPPDKAHPYLFINKGNVPETRKFVATAQAIQDGVAVPLSPVSEYGWKWAQWATSDNTIVTVAGELPNNVGTSDVADATSAETPKNGNAILTAFLEITKDEVSVPSTTGNGMQGIASVAVLVCENPWPDIEASPFRDVDPSGTVPKSSFVPGDEFYGGPFYNFSTMYCRDAGKGADKKDDLPLLEINQVKQTSLDAQNGILRQYLFTYPPETESTREEYRGLQKDGIGIRIVTNPQHLSPAEWFRSKGFGSSPKSMTIDGYPAVSDGTTIYVAAANRVDSNGGKIYSNIYLISYNPDAGSVTKGIYDQMVKYLTFNINMLNQSNVCIEDDSENPYTDITLNYGKPIKCSADWTCLTIGVPKLHCDSDKQKIIRDTTRITDFQSIARTLEGSRDSQGKYPQALAGTYLRNFSNSLWSSWVSELGQATGKTLPIDPVNRFLTCGRCQKTNTPCRNNNDCPKTEDANECQGGIEVGGAWTPNADIDPQTCWDQKNHKYVCPRIGFTDYGSSRLYQYQSLVGGTRYELGAEFEIPPTDPKNWWSPTLAQGVYQCITTSTLGNFCAGADGLADDKLCRPCPDPNSCKTCQGGAKNGNFCADSTNCDGKPCLENSNDYPVISGACRQFGGTYKYSDICTNQAFGDSGVCGDGVLNLSGGEICEIGQTKYLPCTVPVTNEDGFRRQMCDPNSCTGYIDDIQHPQCIPAIFCGNGRIDKGCGGTINKPCLSDADCTVTVSCTPVETCDDGSLNNTYGHCNNNCQGPAAYCGDSALSPGEFCDNGVSNGVNGNGDYESKCSLDCKSVGPFCGDAEINGPEQCDGGAEITKSKICSAPVSAAGKLKCAEDTDCGAGGVCGGTEATKSCEGVIDSATGRETQHSRVCKNVCSWSDWSDCLPIGSCGDGIMDFNEECDSGEGNGDTKACTSKCKKNTCGDGKVYVGVEECDSGEDNGSVTCSADYDSMCLSCSASCKFQATAGGYCGDAQKNGPEQCDGNGPATASASCPFSGHVFEGALCPIVSPSCTQPPCGATIQAQGQTEVTCKSLGYDFSKNLATPSITEPGKWPTGVVLKEEDKGAEDFHLCTGWLSFLDNWAQRMMYHICLGLTCNPTTHVVTYQNPLPSVKDFWKCVAEKGPDYGIKINTIGEIVSCTPSCGFGNCARCSDEPGTGTIEGRVLDAIYQRAVPGARVSLLYKGTKVDEAFADQNGYFKFTTLNTNSACNSYRMVVDYYQDNVCTNLEHDGYDCCETDNCTPPLYSPRGIDEGQTGGYIPYTSDTFSHESYMANAPADIKIVDISLMPRPAPGSAYLYIGWDYASGFREMWQIHTILPLWPDSNTVLNQGFVVPLKGHKSTSWEGEIIGKCDYFQRPAGNRECARDITWKSMGLWDIEQFPNAKNICLRRFGDVSTSQWAGKLIDACPFEGPQACLALLPKNIELGEDYKWDMLKCMLTEPESPGYEICHRCGADASHYENGENQCQKNVSWEDCIDITYPPVLSMVNYNAMSLFGGVIEFDFAKNGKGNNHTDLYQRNFKATVVSSDKSGNVVVKNFIPPPGVGHGYVWRIAQINATTGDIFGINEYVGTADDVKKVQQNENLTDKKESASSAVENAKPVPGMACYRHEFQCTGSGFFCNNDAPRGVGSMTFATSTYLNALNESCDKATNCPTGFKCGTLDSRVFSHLNW
ncbi:MAG: IPT/TIG domain-containing protein [Patescibacteria group bacterium]